MARGGNCIKKVRQDAIGGGTRLDDVLWVIAVWARSFVGFKGADGFKDLFGRELEVVIGG